MRKSYEEALINFLHKLDERNVAYYKEHFPTLEPSIFEVHPGRKYDKIVRITNQSSVYGFINKETGGIIKAASWKAPEPKKRARGNIFNDNPLDGTTIAGVMYLK